jgi:MinD-like ATPase involved in chromosome partitioning or flagellar assembly
MSNQKRLILITGQKGGVGKSTFARILLDRLRAGNISVAAYDGDGSVGHLLQYYGQKDENTIRRDQDPTHGVGYYDLRNRREREQLMESLHQTADIILHDLPGGASAAIAEAVDVSGQSSEALVQAASDMGFRTTIIIVINTDQASARAVISTIRNFGTEADYVIVKNLNACTVEDFIVFDGFQDASGNEVGGAAAKAADQVDATQIVMPEIYRSTAVKVDLWSLPFSESTTDSRMHIQDKTRITQWIDLMSAEVAKAADKLGV